MSCPGLHCAGCGSKYAVPVAIPVAIVLWIIIQNIVLVLLVVIGAVLISSLAIGWLIKRQDTIEQLACAETRARWQLAASQRQALRADSSRAIGGAQVVNFNFFGVTEDQAANVIRRAVEQ